MDPEPTVQTTATYYNSIYEHGVDEKRRVQVPAKWRPQPGVELTVVLWPDLGAGVSLRVLPPAAMGKLAGEIEAMSNAEPTKPMLKRYIGGGSEQVTLDKAGRICLPDRLAKAAGIVDQAVLVGALDRFEVWSPERFQKVQVADAVMATVAVKMMG